MWKVLPLLALFFLPEISSAPSPEFVVTTKAPSTSSASKEGAKENEPALLQERTLKINEMHVVSNVSNRFTHTLVTSHVKNYADSAREATFSVVLPDTAYIAGFVLEMDGKKYDAYVKEKEEAKQIYNEAVRSGVSAAHVAASARDSNRFDVSVNVEPQKKAAFYLTYEELLQRRDEQYEIVINIHPGQPVKDLSVQVNINESKPLKFVKSPALRSGNEISKTSTEDLDPRAAITMIDMTSAVVKFTPSVEKQKQYAHSLGTAENEGLAGQFVVQYEVQRDSKGGEILLQDGYFVHFFAPYEVPPLPKQVVFVLDTSGSMYDRKIQQLKEAMNSILGELKENDLFNIVDFNSNVRIWDLNNTRTVDFPEIGDSWYSGVSNKSLSDVELPPAWSVNANNIEKAKSIVNKFDSNGGTNIFVALKVALRLVELSTNDNMKHSRQPLIVFLTDGDPTVDLSDPNTIVEKITEQNDASVKAPIFSLSFGDGADKNFLQKLSLHNNGFSRHIYEAADASLQLEEFYRQISSPLLTNVTFKYTPSVSNLTKTNFPIVFHGSELVVSGTTDDTTTEFSEAPKVQAWGIKGPIDFDPVVARSVTHLERLWAYLTVKQILEAREIAADKKPYEQMALDLALKYSFVTPVSSLVVVKPNSTNTAVDAVAADADSSPQAYAAPYASPQGYRGPGFVVAASSISAPTLAGYYLSSMAVPLSSASRFIIEPQTVDLDADTLDSVQEKSIFATLPPDVATTELIETAVSEETTTDLAKINELEQRLPWLNSFLTDDGVSNDTVTIQKGTFRLGINETVTDEPECPNSPMNGVGKCKLLHECPVVHSLLTTVYIFNQYFCQLHEFAGVCCPPEKQATKS